MSIMNYTPLLLTLFLLLHSVTSSYPSHSSPSPSPSSSPVESPQSPSPSPSQSPTQSYSPPAPPPSDSPAPTPTNESPSAHVPAPADDTPIIPTPPPEADSLTNAETMNYVTKDTKKSSGGNGVGAAFGLIGAAGVVILGGAVYKKRRDNIRRSRRYSSANLQLI